MKQLNYHLPLIIFSSIIFCSCTITKRHFGNGYHVEWIRKMKSTSDRQESPKTEEAETDFGLKNSIGSDSIVMEQLITEVPDVLLEPMEDSKASIKPPVHPEKIPYVNKQVETPEEKLSEEPQSTEEAKPRMHPLTWGIWGMWSIGVVFIFFVAFYPEALIGVVVFFFLAMIFAFFIIGSLRKHPEKYRLKKLSYGFVIPAIIFGGIVLAGLGLFLLATLA